MTSSRLILTAVLATFGVLIGCTKATPEKTDDNTCQRTCEAKSDCKGDDICENGCCVAPPPQCATTKDCCPGQTCNIARQCKNSVIECLNDTDCGGSGDLYCLASGICGPKACDSDGNCPESWQSCFAGVCVSSLPCSGGCGDGAACVLASGTCYPALDYCGDEANNVPTGYMAVFNNLTNVYDGCAKDFLKCGVYPLPNITVSDLGRHASMDALDDGAIAAMYDGTHGDLVVVTYDADGKETSSTWVDGVPEKAPIVGALTGPRGGVSEPGDNVGMYTSIQVATEGSNKGEAHIAYYAKDAQSLRYVVRKTDGSFEHAHTVDGGPEVGNVGMYAHLALVDEEGASIPAIAYFQSSAGTKGTCGDVRASDGSTVGARMTALKFAQAKTAHPTNADDWNIQTVACAVADEPACESCPLACIVDETSANGTKCITPETDCLNEAGEKLCKSSQHCVRGQCFDKATYEKPLTNFILGVGLFPHLAFENGRPAIAWYDSIKGNLMLSMSDSGSAWNTRIIDGENDGQDTGDVGLYPFIIFDGSHSGAATIAYHDATRRGLRIASGRSLNSVVVSVTDQTAPSDKAFIDRGYDKTAEKYAPPNSVGADVQLLSTSSDLFAAYQDMTNSDLVLRRRAPDGSWAEVKRWQDGSLGYYVGLVRAGDKLLLGNTRLNIRTLKDKPKASNVFEVNAYTPTSFP